MWLRDRFVAGVYSEAIRRRLLQEKATMTFQAAYQIALSMETANKEAKAIQGSTSSVNKLSTSQRTGPPRNKIKGDKYKPCTRCNSTEHLPPNCPYISAKCNNYRKVGHIFRACRSAKTEDTKRKQPKGNPKKSTHHIDVEEPDVEAEHEDVFEELFMISSVLQEGGTGKWKKTVMVNEKPMRFEVDSGSGVTLVNKEVYKSTFPNMPLTESTCRLEAYLGTNIPVLGKLSVKVDTEPEIRTLSLVVVDGNGSSLLGRNWLKYMEPWKSVLSTHNIKSSGMGQDSIGQLFTEFLEVFDEGLGHLKECTVTLDVRTDSHPVFCKARTVPLALKEKVEEEIDRMEKEDIIERVKYSQWATPVVPVLKSSGEVRLCGDYKTTLNRFLQVETYPIPKVEELLANLNGGEEFTKLDLKHAYQQLELDEKSRRLTTINTSKGLYQFKRLPYGVSTAPALFQRTIEMVLKGLKGVVVFMDDICVTGHNKRQHMSNLKAVLGVLQKAGLKLRQIKCTFFPETGGVPWFQSG
ncbi:uncharacterized protein K02A2.6-like [Haliotis rubra]|uniref:uncharacterized protein K02A2.6-like n=1 Tax=Haliotis rubra TaxID=36100 RepID=UPI001EE50A08|nr:uncharacterized protein K02A2.6-like [Haliotis rubra]